MSSYDRDYLRNDYQSSYGYGGGFLGNLPPMTKYLLYINVGVFLITGLFPFTVKFPPGGFWVTYFSVSPYDLFSCVQIWRLISYQFMHGGLGHILFNMIGLYIFGSIMERAWGSKAFLRFYLIAGAAGGVVYTLLIVFRILTPGYLVGASGSILGLIAAAGLLFPKQELYVFGIIPVKISILAIIAAILSILGFLSGENAGGEAAHLTGLGVGVFYVFVRPRMVHWRMERSKGAWKRKLEQEQRFHSEVDQILDKVHKQGIASLTSREKEILREATRREQQEDAKLSKHL